MRIMQMGLAAKLLALAGAGMLAAGCASSPAVSASYEIDYARVAQIEHLNRMQGSQVVWINYPLKQVNTAK
jgi:hypothetical protein